MKKKPEQMVTELVFVLDRSGSMQGLEQDTIGSFNSLIEEQKKEPGMALVSTVLFDDECEVVHDRVPLDQVGALTSDQYCVRGCTALLDAIGFALQHVDHAQKIQPQKRPDKTLVVITTDGMENASRTFTYEKVRQLIDKRRRKRDWEFLFLGANIDAIGTAASMGIQADHATSYLSDSQGTQLSYAAVSAAALQFRSCSEAGISPRWKASLEQDVQARG